jgi:hypothetical protein
MFPTSKCSSQDFAPKHPQSVIFFRARDNVLHPYKTTGKMLSFAFFTIKYIHFVKWQNKSFGDIVLTS